MQSVDTQTTIRTVPPHDVHGRYVVDFNVLLFPRLHTSFSSMNQNLLIPHINPMRKEDIKIALDVFVEHFGTEYATTFSKPEVRMLACGFRAALDLIENGSTFSNEVFESIMQRVEE